MDIKSFAPHAMPYNKYGYLWSPRPETKAMSDKLPLYDDGSYLAQPKMDGSNTLLFLNEDGTAHIKNRHNQDKTGVKIDCSSLYRGTGWMVLNGEWMEKSKCDETGNNFNGNFVIFDVLVYNSYILTGSTVQNRVHLLNDLYGSVRASVQKDGSLAASKKYLYRTNTSNVFRVVSFEKDFQIAYNLLTQINMYEGLVLKKKSALLQLPYLQTANSKWQLKFRKPHKNYKF